MNNFKVLMNGIVKENPTFVLLLGMCPTLGTTSSAINGMGMGLATMFVLICSNVVISSIKNLIPDMVRIPAFIVVYCIICNLVADDYAGICAGAVCYFGIVYSVDCGKLYLAGTRRSVLLQRTVLFLHFLTDWVWD